ncbi:hypothetical protein KAU11_00485 [Candidatus Babeliales bacterium]|nr:hypothetical protein [Candidatus Babeliales bacterium]
MSLKDIFIKKLHQLPEDILQEVFYLDVVTSKGSLQWSSFLADKYKDQEVGATRNWLYFKFSGWKISMERIT